MPKVLTAGSLRAWSVYGELNLRGLGSTLALLRVFNIAGIKTGGIVRGMTSMFGLLAKGVSIAGLAFGALVSGSVRAFSNFDSAMTQSLAIMGDMTETMRGKLAAAARLVGKTMQFTAAQAAEGYFFLASAGFTVEQSLAALPAVANFAQAGMFDLATATDLATDAQSALGLRSNDAQENLRNMVRVTDVLVTANKLANATVEQFSETITNKFGARLKILNKDIEEGVGVMAALADQGVKGRIAGQRLTIVFRDLATSALTNSKAYKKLKVSIFDNSGAMRNMADIIDDLDAALEGASVKTRLMKLQTLGLNKRASDALVLLLGLGDRMREYEAAARDAGGATETIAQKQLGAFKLGILRAKRAVSDLAITLGGQLAPVVLGMANALKTFTESLDAEQMAKQMVALLKSIMKGFAMIIRTMATFMINTQLSLPEIAVLGFLGFLLLGPLGLMVFPIIAGALRKHLGRIFPAFLTELDASEIALDKLNTMFDASTQRLISLRGEGGEEFAKRIPGQSREGQIEAQVAIQENFAEQIREATKVRNAALISENALAVVMLTLADTLEALDATMGGFGAGSGAVSSPSDAIEVLQLTAKEQTQWFLDMRRLAGQVNTLTPGGRRDNLGLGLTQDPLGPDDFEVEEIDRKKFKRSLGIFDMMFEMGEEAKKQAKNIGRGIINGLVDGTLSMKDLLKTALKGILNVALSGLFGFLEMGSPSKLMMGVGRNITIGLVDGILEEKARLTNAMMQLGHVVAGSAGGIGVGGIPGGALGLTPGTPRGLGSLDLSKMPAAKNPLDSHRDAEWQEWMRNSMLHAEDSGFRFERIGR